MTPITRRSFVKSGTALACLGLPALEWLISQARGDETSPMLKGFIVSDSHFGWIDSRCPPVAEKVAAMNNILQRLPDLDIFLDTGDGHHNYAKDSDYGDWTDVVVRGCGPLPMFFTGGNHEEDGFGYTWDPEVKTGRMGSTSCRPYYSFDVKGVHFISMPQLMTCNLVTQETLDWVALDLALNKDKTVIALSHNSLKGTTEPLSGDLAYRLDVNSKEVYDVLNSHKQVIAWMHGHNHDYRIVPKPERVYVSNGRLGGFPELLAGVPDAVNVKPHLGGIYFEVHPDRFVVRCYSATEGKFFDEMPGCSILSHERPVTTSFAPSEPFRVSYGHGNMLNGTKLPIYQYHAGSSSRELYFSTLENPVFNDNAQVTYYGKRTNGEIILPALQLSGTGRKSAEAKGKDKEKGGGVYTWNNPGITLHPTEKIVVSAPGNSRGQRGYYPVSPGQDLGVRLQFGKVPAGASLTPRLFVASNLDQKTRGSVSAAPLDLSTEGQVGEWTFHVPDNIADGTIYADPSQDLILSAWVEFEFTNLAGPTEIQKLEMFVKNQPKTEAAAFLLNGEKLPLAADGKLVPVKLKPAPADREVAQVELAGPVRGAFLIRETPSWQARNAPLAMRDGSLHIGESRNKFSPKMDVILASLQPTTDPFVHRLGGLAPAVVHPYDPATKQISVDFEKIDGPGEIECVCSSKPSQVKGTADWTFDKNRLLLRVKTPGTVSVAWA